jgi:methylated-DNA-[protein]-cysteine S-methyltransferase
VTDRGLTLFDTPIGRCGIAWAPGGVVAIQLPERDDRSAIERLARRAPGVGPAAPPYPPHIEHAMREITALLSGDHVGLADIPLEFEGVPDFDRRVYDIARAIPPGATRTYGDVARDLGDLTLSRAVGQALGRNPFPIVIPCHRVVAAGGETGGFSATGGAATKRRILAIEMAQGDLFDAH